MKPSDTPPEEAFLEEFRQRLQTLELNSSKQGLEGAYQEALWLSFVPVIGSVLSEAKALYDVLKASKRADRTRSAHEQLFDWTVEQIRDLTAQMGLAQPGLEDAAQYMLNVDNGSDAFFVKDLAQKYVHINASMETVLEKGADSILGRTDRDLYDTNEAEFLSEAFLRAVRGELVQYQRSRMINGQEKTVIEVLVAKRGRDYKPVGVYGICRDITDSQTPAFSLPETGDWQYPSYLMQETLRQCLQVAAHKTTVLLTGETGSGKSYLAEYIHDHSSRRDKPFRQINCAAIPENMAESELFGHEKGAFTGASGRKRGLLELAEGGTVFLDEIGELSLTVQSKLLTFLDSKTFSRLGSEKTLSVDVRLIAATHRNLRVEIQEGRFLDPLYQRLNVFPISLPPLRKRSEDISVIVHELLNKLAEEQAAQSPPAIELKAVRKLQTYAWPGNVRELKNVLERAIIRSPEAVITADAIHFHSEAEASPKYEAPVQANVRPLAHMSDEDFKHMYEEVCVRLVEKKGERLGEKGSATAIAKVLKFNRTTISRKLERLDCPAVEKGTCSRLPWRTLFLDSKTGLRATASTSDALPVDWPPTPVTKSRLITHNHISGHILSHITSHIFPNRNSPAQL